MKCHNRFHSAGEHKGVCGVSKGRLSRALSWVLKVKQEFAQFTRKGELEKGTET
jgi:hypothetical protein